VFAPKKEGGVLGMHEEYVIYYLLKRIEMLEGYEQECKELKEELNGIKIQCDSLKRGLAKRKHRIAQLEAKARTKNERIKSLYAELLERRRVDE
jgi:chromosome segregation ATPase